MATCREVKTFKVCIKVILEASFARKAVAVTAYRQFDQPCATKSKLLDKYLTIHSVEPNFWVSTPRSIPCFLVMDSQESFVR